MKTENARHVLTLSEWSHSNDEYFGFELMEGWVENGQTYPSCKRTIESDDKPWVVEWGIKVSCQCDANRKEVFCFYAFKTGFSDRDIDMGDIDYAEYNLRKLKAIAKKYYALCEQFGRPETFSQYVSYIARIIKADIVIYDSNLQAFRTIDVDGLRIKERKLLEKHFPVMAK